MLRSEPGKLQVQGLYWKWVIATKMYVDDGFSLDDIEAALDSHKGHCSRMIRKTQQTLRDALQIDVTRHSSETNFDVRELRQQPRNKILMWRWVVAARLLERQLCTIEDIAQAFQQTVGFTLYMIDRTNDDLRQLEHLVATAARSSDIKRNYHAA